MVTKQQALTARVFHYVGKQQCKRTVGPRGGVKVSIVECRRNGATKTWKTRPQEFRVPVKYGMYEYAYISQDNAEDWHTAEDCPLLAEDCALRNLLSDTTWDRKLREHEAEWTEAQRVVHNCAEHKDMEMV